MSRKQKQVWFDEEKVRSAFMNSKSMTDIILRLGEPLGSASFRHCKNAAVRYGLVLPVYDKKASNTTAAALANTRPLEEILVENSTYSNRQHLKKRLIKAGLKVDVCESCGIGPEWNGKALVLQLDHVNGVGDDNRLENLAVLCPNCHSQTDTFGYRPNSNGRRVAGIPC